MKSIYNTDKIIFHPNTLEALRRRKPTAPISIMLMPENRCNQACSFCSYGSGPESVRAKVENPAAKLWKNQQIIGHKDSLPVEKMRETIDCLVEMGTKAVEVTGGGEPTIYPYFDEMCQRIGKGNLEFALVTNGTLMPDDRISLLADLPFVWVRVSIDAGSPEEYVNIRHVPESHWGKAWYTVERLAKVKRHPEARVGVGYVIDRTNWKGLYEGCRLAKLHGADNVRVSMSFTPDGTARWGQEIIDSVVEQMDRARELEDDNFHLNNLSVERIHNVVVGRQEYPMCPYKELGGVLGPDCIFYSCCSLAFNRLGVMFSIKDQTFKEGWYGDGWEWRKKHDPRVDCPVTCLYEERNMKMLNAMGDRRWVADKLKDAADDPILHKNFI